MNIEIDRIEKEDPTVLKVLIAEYHFLKKDMQKAFDLFTEAYADLNLSPVMRETVRNYLVIAGKELRAKEIDDMDFTIVFDFKTLVGTDHHHVIDKNSLIAQVRAVGILLEIVDYHLKKQKPEK